MTCPTLTSIISNWSAWAAARATCRAEMASALGTCCETRNLGQLGLASVAGSGEGCRCSNESRTRPAEGLRVFAIKSGTIAGIPVFAFYLRAHTQALQVQHGCTTRAMLAAEV